MTNGAAVTTAAVTTPAPSEADPNAGGPATELKALAVRDFSMLIALAAIWSFFAATTRGNFVSPRNLSNLMVELSITAVLALGQLLIIVCGQIDLSIGSGAGLVGGIAAVLVTLHGQNAAVAMGVGTVVAVLIWLAMGMLIVTQKIPAFIITLAGLLIFRGMQWKVIHSATVPVAVGGQENLLSLLTTWYLPPAAGSVLAAVVVAAMAYSAWNERRRRAEFGFPIEPASVAFAKTFVLAQVVVLFTLVCNQYRGIPLSALILAATALVIGVLTRHTRFGRYLYAIGGNEEAALISRHPGQQDHHRRLRHHGPDRRASAGSSRPPTPAPPPPPSASCSSSTPSPPASSAAPASRAAAAPCWASSSAPSSWPASSTA